MPSPSLFQTERGAGGKLRKAPSRRPSSTPYDRPPAVKNGHLASQRKDSGWIFKLVDPAYRIISSGATRIIPSIFTRTPFSDIVISPSIDNDLNEDETNKFNLSTSKLEPTKSQAEAAAETSKLDVGTRENGKASRSSHNVTLTEIEQIMTTMTFSREEANRLTGILQSKMQKHDETEAPRTTINASPVEIARAYMKSRYSETDRSTANASPEPAALPSSVCWPGAVFQTQDNTHRPSPYSRRYSSTFKTKDSYGSVGPIRRTRRSSITPSNNAPPVDDDVGDHINGKIPIQEEKSFELNLAKWRKTPSDFSGPGNDFDDKRQARADEDERSAICEHQSDLRGTPVIHIHTTRTARRILNHIDRQISTSTEKSVEINLARWRKPTSVLDHSTNFHFSRSGKDLDDNRQTRADEHDKPSISSIKDASAIREHESEGEAWRPVTRPNGLVLASATVKPYLALPPSSSSAINSAFTFPVSSTNSLPEPPTPSFLKPNLLPRCDEPLYIFGRRFRPRLVFSFSQANTGSSDILFGFGSECSRLSFSFVEKALSASG